MTIDGFTVAAFAVATPCAWMILRAITRMDRRISSMTQFIRRETDFGVTPHLTQRRASR